MKTTFTINANSSASFEQNLEEFQEACTNMLVCVTDKNGEEKRNNRLIKLETLIRQSIRLADDIFTQDESHEK